MQKVGDAEPTFGLANGLNALKRMQATADQMKQAYEKQNTKKPSLFDTPEGMRTHLQSKGLSQDEIERNIARKFGEEVELNLSDSFVSSVPNRRVSTFMEWLRLPVINEMGITSQDQDGLRTIIDKLLKNDMAWMKQQDIKVGDKGAYWILNYGMQDKNEYNRLARGLVVQKPQRGFSGDNLQLIKSFPFIRFFNQGESQADQINLNDAEMLEKLDGCFDKDTKISFCNGEKIRIKDVVEQKLEGPVWGFNHKDGKIVPVKITHWHNNGLTSDWKTIKITDENNGNGFRNIMCTPNHLFCNENFGYTKAVDLQESCVWRLRDSLTPVQKSVVLGSLLGDLHLRNDGGWCVSWSHVIEQDSLSKKICDVLGPLRNYSSIELREDSFSKKPKVRYNIHGTEVFEPIVDLCIFEGKKKVTKEWLAEVDDIALAIWYMDDGSLSKGNNQRPRALLHTEGFSSDEVDLIMDFFREKHNFNPSSDEYRGYRNIRLNADDAEIFWSKISFYILEHFDYKLPEKFRSKEKFWDTYKGSGFNKRLKKNKVLSVVEGNYRVSKKRTTKYDITTETSNFFADEILVHNSMVGVFFPAGNSRDPHWHTRNMLSSHQPDLDLKVGGFAGGENKLMEIIGQYVKRLNFNKEDASHTYVFEFIHKASTVLTKYNEDQWGLYLLAGRNLQTHVEEPEDKLDEIASRIGAGRPKRWDAVADDTEIARMMKELSTEIEDFEGMVFRDRATGKRVKLKNADYVAKHHMIGDVSYKRLIPKVLEGEDQEIISYFPHAKEKVEKIKERHDSLLKKIVDTVLEFQVQYKDLTYLSPNARKKELWYLVSSIDEKFIKSFVMNHIETDPKELEGLIDQELKQHAVVSFSKDTFAGNQVFQIATKKYMDMLNLEDDDEDDEA